MALRVLLADESTTIKKVMQLALQDFAVEVKAVHVGVDVVAVARQFQPDIIFADVLLQKKNGYEVCTDLKQDAELRSIPVVLMWSSFMDLDEALAANCGADRRLEKPFDIENLRQLLLELVPKTHTQRLAHFLKFPASFSDPMRKEESAKQSAPPPKVSAAPPITAPAPAPATPPPQRQVPRLREQLAPQAAPPPVQKPVVQAEEESPAWNMDSFEDISAFEAPLHKVEKPQHAAAPSPNVPDLEATSEDEESLDLDSKYGTSPDDDDDEEVFSELRLQDQSAAHAAGEEQEEEDAQAFQNLTLTQEIPNIPARAPEESDDPWSHQDLSRFKVDLPPVTASNPEHGIDLEIPETDAGDYSSNQAQTLRGYEAEQETPELTDTQGYDAFSFGGNHPNSQRKTPLHPDEIAQAEEEVVPNFELDQDDLQLSADADYGSGQAPPKAFNVNDDDRTQQISYEAPKRSQRTNRPAQESEDFSNFDAAKIPQLSPERLEQIIRAQAREIVESVVRKIVPDLATDIIREELQRLLEDTSTYEGRTGDSQSASGSRGRIR